MKEFRLQSDKCCDFDDFTTLLKSLIDNVMPGVTFTEAFSKGINPENVDTPVITYKVVRRAYADKEIKPRPREQFIDTEDPTSSIMIYGQRFEYLVEFNIWGESNEQANECMNKFEDVIFTYTGDLKQNGVHEIIFSEQGESNNSTQWRPNLANRILYYLVKLEKLTVIRTPKTRMIVVRANDGLRFTIQE